MVTAQEYEKAERELTLSEWRRGWNVHAAIYTAVNTALVLVNVFAVPEFFWFPFPLVCWGIGLTLHYLHGVRWAERELLTRRRSSVTQRSAAEPPEAAWPASRPCRRNA